ncbi:zona pellucida sperm-binding protein 3-like [Lampris incognitus]|uniref:zona pellucida sperm-binding protein 3-like n=1 Tax=Lampris incognitus TaxID=2546036 RepID=UPI0024B4C47A|nr:zona pellucida sperm-binding protein 3-like [Lampris incognitus]
MAMKWTSTCLVAVAVLGCLCDAQWGMPSKPGYQKPSTPQLPSKQVPLDPQQSKQTFEKAVTWSFPDPPKPEPKVDVPFELRSPVPAVTVAVECREKIAHVEVKKDMFGIGQFINPADLLLGNCDAVGEDPAAQVLIFEAELHECDSKTMTTADALIYTFVLNYKPRPFGNYPVLRTSAAAVFVECYYPRKHNVSSLPLDPLWIPFSAAKVSEEVLYFTLRLMTEDWQYERPMYQYFLGDMIYIEATVKQYFHAPLRVFVDRCVAVLTPDLNTNPQYAFIDNHGCFIDAYITGSKSKFRTRTAENKLQLQLEAFRFQGAETGVMYLICHLKATSTAYGLDDHHRACSYSNGWKEASGADGVCGLCEAGVMVNSASTGGAGSGGSSGLPISPSNPGRKIRAAKREVVEWEGDVTVGPIAVVEEVL